MPHTTPADMAKGIIPAQSPVRKSRRVFGMVEKGHRVERGSDHQYLATCLHEFAERRRLSITIVERVVGSEPVGLSADCR
jgi:hypothetical protein